MAQSRGRAGLDPESAHGSRVLHHLREENFQRHHSLHRDMQSFKDSTHASFTELFLQYVWAEEEIIPRAARSFRAW